MASVEEICDNIALINHSEVVLQGNVNEVRSRFKSDTYTLSVRADHPLKDTALFQATLTQASGNESHYTLRKLQEVSNSDLLSEVGQAGRNPLLLRMPAFHERNLHPYGRR